MGGGKEIRRENKGETPLNLDGWTLVGTFGYRTDIYAKGNQRVLVNRESKEVICQYKVGDGRQVDGYGYT